MSLTSFSNNATCFPLSSRLGHPHPRPFPIPLPLWLLPPFHPLPLLHPLLRLRLDCVRKFISLSRCWSHSPCSAWRVSGCSNRNQLSNLLSLHRFQLPLLPFFCPLFFLLHRHHHPHPRLRFRPSSKAHCSFCCRLVDRSVSVLLRATIALLLRNRFLIHSLFVS